MLSSGSEILLALEHEAFWNQDAYKSLNPCDQAHYLSSANLKPCFRENTQAFLTSSVIYKMHVERKMKATMIIHTARLNGRKGVAKIFLTGIRAAMEGKQNILVSTNFQQTDRNTRYVRRMQTAQARARKINRLLCIEERTIHRHHKEEFVRCHWRQER